ncbi:MAG TPA: NFACT RNA binding domain-containing protein [Planctomycetota bacterium]|nr:NFACT RNA binding domain-containing protein [Planctomycetota bacterium]
MSPELSLAARHVAELASELQPLFEGAHLLEVEPLPPRDLDLLLERDGARRRLRLSADPEAPRLHLVHSRVERHRGPPGPFYRRAREELAGARLRRIEPVRGDRIARVEFAGTPSGGARSLVLELFGRRANLLLLDAEDRLLEALVPPSGGAALARLAPGTLWQPPPSRGEAQEAPPLAQALPEPPAQPDRSAADAAPLSWRVEVALGSLAERVARERAARRLAERLERRLSRARALERGLEERLRASEGAERVREDGELLTASLARLHRGLERVELEDFFAADVGGGEGSARRTIELDPRKSPRENVEALFERYRKLVRSRGSVEDELSRARARREALESFMARASTAEDPDALAEEAIEAGLLEPEQEPVPARRAPPEPRRPYRSFRGLRGSEIRVGRTAADNDALTLRHARGNDLWLHTADAPGSHVVLRLERGAEPDPEELLDAAHLAAHFSPLRGRPKIQVHVARRKEVHKPRGAKPGLVQLSGGRVLALRVQPERLERLLASARRPPPGSGPAGEAGESAR